MDVAVVLGLIGVLTTPPLSGGASLSEMWAFVRYFLAVTDDSDLRLTDDFQSMDPHQKTILSDDFGMGFTMHWLTQKLGLRAACDGRYFIENHLSNVGGSYAGGTAKRGPGKSPDFVALDQFGRLHVIECKGTQSSLAYRNSQLTDSARAQKTTIRLPPNLRGERLAAGIFIGGPTGDKTALRVIDPDHEDEYVIKDEDPTLVRSAVVRGMLAKQFRSAGLPRYASAVAFPQIRMNMDDPEIRIDDEEAVLTRRAAGEAELREATSRTFESGKNRFIGRSIEFPFSRPLRTRRGIYVGIQVRQGFEKERLERLGGRALEPKPFSASEADLVEGKYHFGEANGRAWIRLGQSYFTDLRLMKSI